MKQVLDKTMNFQASMSWPAVFEAGGFRTFVVGISRVLDRIAGFAIVISMLLVVANIFTRLVFNKPILGTMEYVSFLAVVAIAFSLAMCAVRNGHIAVDLVMDRLPSNLRGFIDGLVLLVTVIFLGVCSWGLFQYGASSAASGLVSPTTQTPVYPFIYLVAVGFAVFALVQLMKLMDCLGKGGK